MARPETTQVERLLDLVPFLVSHQGIAVEDLAKEFGVPVNEIIKDLNALWMCGLPGYTPLELIDLEFESGFVSIRNAETLQSPRALSKIELLSLVLGLEILGNDGIEVTSLKNRLHALLGSAISLSIESKSGSKIRVILRQALDAKQLVTIDYHSIRTDSIEERIIEPLELSIENGCEYVLAYCHKAHSHRTFRVDRISSAIISATSSEHSHVITHETASSNLAQSVDIEISQMNRSIQERLGISHTHPKIPFTYAIQAFSQEWAIRTVMAGGGALRVLAPQEISSGIHERALRAISLYK